MSTLKRGSRVRLLRKAYSDDDTSRPYYVKRMLDAGAAILTTKQDLSMPDHTVLGEDVCLCYSASYFEPYLKPKTEGFVNFVRKLEGVS